MKEAYLGFRTLTEAQRASEQLHRSRIYSRIVRMPALPGKQNCAYGLRLKEETLDTALSLLKRGGYRTGRILIRGSDGVLQERQA